MAVNYANLQTDLNRFRRKFLMGLKPIKVDGKPGPSTNGAIITAKFFLGYKRPINDTVDATFLFTLKNPTKVTKFNTRSRIKLARKRRVEGRARWAHNLVKAVVTSGVTRFDGIPVAAWLVPYLVWARANGWRGHVVSGWRDPKYSQALCYRMCGAPSCSGRCAGLNSNHVGSVKPRGALDLTDYAQFGALMRRCPLSPRLFNALGARDPVHFSASGN